MDAESEGIALVEKHLMVPEAALVINRNSEHKAALRLYDIQGGNLVNPRALTRRNIVAIRSAIDTDDARSFSGMIPNGLVHLNGNRMAFMVPAGMHYLFFGDDKKSRKAERFLPPMLFVYEGPEHKLNVYWCKSEGRETMVVPAPMPNINSGSVCLGNSMKRMKYTPDIGEMMERVKTAFFGSLFNEWRTQEMVDIMRICEQPINGSRFWSNKTMQAYTKGKWMTLESVVDPTGHTSGY